MLDTFKETLSKLIRNPIAFVIGGVLHSFWFLIIPELFVLGYFDRLMRSINYGISDLPKWNNWKNLMYRGALLFSIIIIYMFPGLLIAMLSKPDISGALNGNLSFGIMYWVSIAVIFILSFLMIGALTSYIKREKLIDAFNIREIIFTITTHPKEYVSTYLVFMLLSPISIVAYIVPLAGIIVFGFVNFYILTAGFSSIAKMGGVSVEESEGLQNQEEYYY